jgi:hypothetical protein
MAEPANPLSSIFYRPVNRQTFFLQQFRQAPETAGPRLAVGGSIGRHDRELFLQYQVAGDIKDLTIPRSNRPGSRRHGLWRESCFECFIGMKNSNRYWEINLAASGDWNVYSFSSYRQDMTEETAFQALPSFCHATRDELRLDLIVDLSRIVREGHALEIGISTVLKLRNGDITLWSLRHPGPKADFHHRSGFLLAK